ncbi:MAG: carbohydrate ABC transporter permease [Bacillota bacterium]
MRRYLKSATVYLLLSAGGLTMLVPFAWLILSSIKPLPEVMRYPPTFIPEQPTLDNFRQVFKTVPFGRYYLNSVIVSVPTTLVTVLTCTMAGFGFAKYRFAGRSVLFWVILSTMMIPYPATIVPLYVMAHRAGLVDSYAGLIVVHLSSAFGIFMMRQFLSTLPDEMMDAARIDGASEARILVQIVLPHAKPAMAALSLFTFTGYWNAYIWPLIVVNSERLKTLPIAIPEFSGQYFSFQNLINAASLMAIAPVLLIFLLAQRYMVEGIAFTGSKG